MLRLVRAPARVSHQPSLPPAIERASCRSIAAAIRHHPAHHHPLHAPPPQSILQICIDKRIVRVLLHHRHLLPAFVRIRLQVFEQSLDLRLQLPFGGAAGDAAIRPPFADELVAVRRPGQLGFGVAVLREDGRERLRAEVVHEGEDVGEGVLGHWREEGLHVDDQ